MDKFDNLVIRNKIIDILSNQNEINSEHDDVNEIVDKIKMFMSNLETFSINLINMIEKFPKTNNQEISNTKSDNSTRENKKISYDKYINLSLPLYVIYFFKKSSICTIKLPSCVSITSYDNLVKESEYKSLRTCHQVILMWKNIGNGCYIILSIILADINEIDFYQKRYFISYVGGTNINECEHNWNAYNKINVDKLIHGNHLMSLREAIHKLITIDDYSDLK